MLEYCSTKERILCPFLTNKGYTHSESALWRWYKDLFEVIIVWSLMGQFGIDVVTSTKNNKIHNSNSLIRYRNSNLGWREKKSKNPMKRKGRRRRTFETNVRAPLAPICMHSRNHRATKTHAFSPWKRNEIRSTSPLRHRSKKNNNNKQTKIRS